MQVWLEVRIPLLTLFLLPLHTCSFWSQKSSWTCILFFSVDLHYAQKVVHQKSIFNFHSGMASALRQFNLNWDSRSELLHDRITEHSAISFLICMELWPRDSHPVSDCMDMLDCTLGESAASLTMLRTSCKPLIRK